MTERNRVTPFGELVAEPWRGVWTGNRGRLHEFDGHGRPTVVRESRGDLWIICALRFHGRHSELFRRGRFTWLFFGDEAQALAAGHRPCGECRHAAYGAYVEAWQSATGGPRPTATEMNRALQRERFLPRSRVRARHEERWAALPDGTFVALDGSDGPDIPALVLGDELFPWAHGRYGSSIARPRSGAAQVVTPPSTVAALRGGYPVQIDPTAHSDPATGASM